MHNGKIVQRTMLLRARKTKRGFVLEQAWRVIGDGMSSLEWREIPIVPESAPKEEP